MEKILKCLFVVLLLLGQTSGMAQSLIVNQSDYSQSSYAFTVPHFTVSDVQAGGAVYTAIDMDGASPSVQVGRPDLPIITEAIEIPLCSSVEVSVSNVQTKRLSPLKYPMMPVQPAPSKSDRYPLPFAIDSAFYSTDAFTDHPAAWAEVLGVARDRNIAMLRVSPFAYNPVTGELNLITSMDITLTFQGADIAATQQMHQRYYSPDFSLCSSLLSTLPAQKSVRQGAPIHYLIVAHSSFRGHLDQFINWKKRQGFLVTVGYTDEAAVGTTATAIANYTKRFYDNASASLPAPTYLLIVGDHQQVPAFGSRATSPSSSHVTDLYYTTWTSGDNIPDCYVGRFSAKTVAELTPQIEKTLLYEGYNFADPSYLNKGVLISGVDSRSSGDNAYRYADPAMDYIAKYYLNAANGFSDVQYFKNNTSFAPAGVTVTGSSQTTATSNTLINLYNQGCGFVNYSAHGDDNCWNLPYFSSDEAADMTNSGKPSIFIGNCCLSGRFNTTAGDCLGEALLHKGNNAGAVAYIGATNSTYWPHDFCWQVGFRSSIYNEMNATYDAQNLGVYDRLFHTHGERYSAWHTTTGAMVTAGNMSVEATGSYQLYYWEIYENFGDPSLMPWLATPAPMTVSYSSAIVLSEETYTVRAVPYAYVALTTAERHDLVAAAYADANGVASLSLPGDMEPGELELAVWAQNHIPVFEQVSVIMTDGPYVMVTDIVPTSGKLHAGEVTTFDITVTNVGTSTSANGRIDFASGDAGVSVIQPQSRFTSCPPGDTVTITGVNAVYLSDELVDGDVVCFDLNVHFGGTGPSSKTQTFIVSSSHLEASAATVVPALAANTTSTISCVVTNTGSDTTSNLTFSLVNDFGLLAAQAADQMSAPLAPGESVALSFVVTFGASIPNATIPFYLYVTDDRGTHLVKEYGVISGSGFVENFETGNFSQFGWVQEDNPWEITSGQVNRGRYSARSKTNLNNRSTSSMSISWTSNQNDSISFSYKVSSEESYDKFVFYIDGTQMLAASGEEGWTRVSYPVEPGSHTFTFAYTKDMSASDGSDCAWIDDVRFPYKSDNTTFVVDTVCQGVEYTFAGRAVNTANTGVFAYVDSTAGFSQYLSLNVMEQPEVEISVEQFGGCRLLKASGASTYQWSTGETGNCIVICPSESIHISVTGFRGGCSATASVDILGVRDAEPLSEVRLYPNPAKDNVTVAADGIRSVQLISLMGQTLQHRQVNADQVRLNLQGLQTGVYFVKVETAAAVTVKKLVLN